MRSPIKISHVVMQTNQVPAMRDWYCTVLDAKPVLENDQACFLSYDDEHHRIGLLAFDTYTDHDDKAAGVNHVAFTYESLERLLENHERLKAEGVSPTLSLNHGPTISLYYLDPDGNRIELQVDVFQTNEEVNRFLDSELFRSNPGGVEFDPDQLLARLRAGTPAEELMRRTG
jgi:catechol-2,3-dioxygenase